MPTIGVYLPEELWERWQAALAQLPKEQVPNLSGMVQTAVEHKLYQLTVAAAMPDPPPPPQRAARAFPADRPRPGTVRRLPRGAG
jgi:hypothetical protein